MTGVALFMYKDSPRVGGSTGSSTAAAGSDGLLGVGELLLLASLTCYGLPGSVQERMKAEHQTKSGHMMKSMNKWSIAYLGVALALTGEGFRFASFVARHPSVIWQLASLSVASALGQVRSRSPTIFPPFW